MHVVIFRHLAAILMSMHFSLAAGFSISNLLQPLVFTEASNTPTKSLRRYLLTSYHVFLWLTGDVFDPDSEASKSLHTVRQMHATVARQMHDKKSDRVYVSQYDMALVQSGFFGAIFMYPRKFGVYCTRAELEDYVYVWRVIGYVLGVRDVYNICSGSYERVLTNISYIERQIVIPALRDPPGNFDMMLDAYINGLNLPFSIKLQSKQSVLALIWDSLKEPVPFKLSVKDRLRVCAIKLLRALIYWCPAFEKFLNFKTSQAVLLVGKQFLKTQFENQRKRYL